MAKNFNSNLFVKYVPNEVTEEEISKVFSTYGKILSIKLKKKFAPFQTRFQYAFVLFEKVEDCQNAIRNLHETRPFGNTPINV